jgi:transposase
MDILQQKIGVDIHPHRQTAAFVAENGKVKTRTFLHSDKKAIEQFYRQFPKGTIVGFETGGNYDWFEKMLFEIGLEVKIGHARTIRKWAPSVHKSDERDARHILDLLMSGRFPEVVKRTPESRQVLSWLNHRDFLVKKRTSVSNQLQAQARSAGMDRFRMKQKGARKGLMEVELMDEYLVNLRFSLLDTLNLQIADISRKLHLETEGDETIARLLTHPGIGDLTALCLVHTLGDVTRFARKEQVTAFVGLVPTNESSGDKHRIGKLTKHGSRLLRFLLGQGAQSTKDDKLRNFYGQVSRRRGAAKAKVAVARKLLERCYIMMRDGIDYEEFRRRGEVGLPEKPGKQSDCNELSLTRDGAASHFV